MLVVAPRIYLYLSVISPDRANNINRGGRTVKKSTPRSTLFYTHNTCHTFAIMEENVCHNNQ